MLALSNRVLTILNRQGVDFELMDPRDESFGTVCERDSVDLTTVVIDLGGRYLMVATGSGDDDDWNALSDQLRDRGICLADECLRSVLMPGCEPGAEPAPGLLCGLPVFVTPRVGRASWVRFMAGDHSVQVAIRYRDFERLVMPHALEELLDRVAAEPLPTAGARRANNTGVALVCMA
ncbi:MAG: hypothetical protein WD768_08660 [Phycisphaeraceae bacterium]